MDCYLQTKYTPMMPPKIPPRRESLRYPNQDTNNYQSTHNEHHYENYYYDDDDNDNNNNDTSAAGYHENTKRYQECTHATEPMSFESYNNNKAPPIPIGMLLKSMVFAEVTFKWPDIIRYSFFATGVLISLLYFFPQSIVLVLLFLVFIVLFVLYFSIITSNKVTAIANKPVDAQKVKRWREHIQQKKAAAAAAAKQTTFIQQPPPPPPPQQSTSQS